MVGWLIGWWLVGRLVGWSVGRSVGWLVGWLLSLNTPRDITQFHSDAADVGLLGGRCCGHREGLAAGLHSAARGGAWQQRGGDWAAPGGEGQPGEDLVGMGGFWGELTMVT